MEKRLLLAFVLSAAILLAWSIIFPPPVPVRPPARPDTTGEAAPPAAEAPPVDNGSAAAELVTGTALGAEAEETIELANDHIAVTLTNRGAAVRSYRLAGYQGDDGELVEVLE